MKHLLFTIFIAFSCTSFGQDDSEDETSNGPVSTTEIGVDGYFGASNLGGSAGIGAKFGYKVNENVIFGPSIRIQRSWNKYYNAQTFGYTIYGGGAWVHARFANALFVGAEFEFLNTPTNYVFVNGQRRWVPTLFAGGGFSKEFNGSIRINAGIFYDIINNGNSPFRPSYFMRKSNGALIPLIYRIGFFFPL